MILIALSASPALAADLEVVLEGSVVAANVDGVAVSGDVDAIVTVDDSVVANEFGAFFYDTSTADLVLDFKDEGFSLLLAEDFDNLAAAFSGNGFVVTQGIYSGSVDFVLGENYVSEPADDFANTTLYPYGAHALIDNGGAFVNSNVNFTSGQVLGASLSFHRVHVRTPDFFETTIDAFYGADIIDAGGPVARQPATLDAKIDALSDAAYAAGCFADVGDPFAGEYQTSTRSGAGMLGDAVSMVNTGGRTFTGTVGALTVDGVQDGNGKFLGVDSAGDLIAGFHRRVAGRRGFWYGVRVTSCTASDLQPWYGASIAGL